MLIFTGRFQPFHNGHLSIIEYLHKNFPNEIICIAIIKDYPFTGKKTEFDRKVDIEIAKRDPRLNAETTLRLINQTLHHAGYNQVVTTLMPRASTESWGVIENLFDCDRTWVFTDDQQGYDTWEKTKCSFYTSLGEKIILVPINKNINSTLLRELVQHEDYTELGKYLPFNTIEFYKKCTVQYVL